MNQKNKVRSFCMVFFFIQLFSFSLSAMDEQDPLLTNHYAPFSYTDVFDMESQEVLKSFIENQTLLIRCAFWLEPLEFEAALNSHFRDYEDITYKQLNKISLRAIGTYTKKGGTLFLLFCGYMLSNAGYSYFVAQIPTEYSWVSESLTALQMVLGVVLTSPLLEPLESYLRQLAFQFRDIKSSSVDKSLRDQLEAIWYDTNRHLSMNAEMSRNIVVYYLLLAQTLLSDDVIKLKSHGTDYDVNQAIAYNLALLFAMQAQLFPELSLEIPIIREFLLNRLRSAGLEVNTLRDPTMIYLEELGIGDLSTYEDFFR